MAHPFEQRDNPRSEGELTHIFGLGYDIATAAFELPETAEKPAVADTHLANTIASLQRTLTQEVPENAQPGPSDKDLAYAIGIVAALNPLPRSEGEA